MKPLLMRKQWLSLDETAQHLSAVYDDKVTNRDVLYFALYDQLTLSIHMVNKLFGRQIELVPIREIQAVQNITIDNCDSLSVLPGSRMKDNETFLISGKLCKLHGLWDLPMIGAERLQIEDLYQRLNGDPQVTDRNIKGAIVRSIKNDELFQVCDCSEEKNSGPKKKSKQNISALTLNENVSVMEDQDGKENKKMLKASKSTRPMSLPEHSVFVVRHESLEKFEGLIPKHTTPIASSIEETSLVNIFAPIDEKYPQELKAALQAWHAIGRDTDDDNTATKLKITAWLKANKDKYRLSNNAISRIATVCNWNKTGGRPKMH